MKKIDISLLILFPVLALIITIFCKTNLFESTLFFFGIPSIYLTIRNHKIFLKSFIFALLLATVSSLFFDVLATLDKSWTIPNSLFSFRFFGIASVEVYFFGFFWVLLSVLFYEHFFEKSRREKIIEPKMKYLLTICVVLSSIVLITYLFNDIQILTIPYIYSWFSLLFIVELIGFLYHYPNFLRKFILIAIYFFFLDFLFEIGALHNGQWIFASTHYIGFVELFNYKFPIEEFVFWMVFCTPALLAIYGFFDDDMK